MRAVRGGARGHRRDRAAGAGDHAVPGGHLHPGLVHVEHLGALPLPVRPHRGLRDPGEPAGVVHAHADDERADVQGEARRRHRARRRARRRLARRVLPRTSIAIYTAHAGGGAAPARAGGGRRRSRSWCSEPRALPAGAAGVHSRRRRRGAVRDERRGARGRQPRRDERRDGRHRARRAGRARRASWCSRPWPADRSAPSTRRRSSCGSRRTTSASSRSRGWSAGIVHARSAGGLPRQLLAARRDAGDPRARCADTATCGSASATCRRSTSAAATTTSTSSSAGPSSKPWPATPRPCARKADELRPAVTPTPRSSSTSRNCACRSTAPAPPTSASARRTSRRRCA